MNDQGIIVEVRIIDRGSLRAFADVTIPTAFGELTVRSFRVIQTDGTAPWVGFPSITYVKDGKTMNKQVLEMPRALQRHIVQAILDEFKAACQA